MLRTIKLVPSVLAVCLLIAANPSIFAAEPQSPGGPSIADSPAQFHCDGCGKAQALKRIAASGGVINDDIDPVGMLAMREAAADTDVLHYDLDIEIIPATEVISGGNVITVESLVDGLTEFTFRLRSNFTITAATVNGSTPITVNNISTTTREAVLDRAYNTGEVFTVEITYNGVAVSRGFGSIEFTSQSGNDLVHTLSEPYFAYTWWPCKDGDYGEPGDMADKATIDIAITAPDNMSSTSNGVLQGVDNLSGSRQRYRWASSYPIATYLVAFSSTNYNSWTATYDYGSGTMPVEFNIYPSHDSSSNRQAWEQCIQMMETFEPLYGLYPFIDEKYGIYQFNFGGGMEHQTNTGQGGFGGLLTVHELGHQWWGDAITCRTWHDIWLNEGFASYTEALWEEFKPGSSGEPALHSYMVGLRPSWTGDSVYVYDTSDMYRIFSSDFSYHKAAWVLHMLRHTVGSDTFFDILAEYRATYEGGAATTDDFAAVASTVYGRDMTWFFAEWVYGIGAPQYRYGWQTEQINGQHYLRLYINQVQSVSYGTYTMPIDVRVNYSGGNETYVVFNDADPEHFVIPIPGAATSIVLDEDTWILRDSLSSTSYVNGPPVVVQADPQPGDSYLPSAAPNQLAVTFSDDVSSIAGDFTVEHDVAGPVAFAFSYSSGNYTATLDFGGPLPQGDYTVTVSDSVQAGGIALDGEIGDPADPASLPSGEGLAGGDAVFTFSVICVGDLDVDNDVDLSDLAALLANFGVTSGATYADGDLDGDGDVDLSDLAELLANFGSTC